MTHKTHKTPESMKADYISIKRTLEHAVTRYDANQSARRHYNPYALPQYLARVDDIMQDVQAGADLRAAITAGFTGSLLGSVLRSLKLDKPTSDEWNGTGRCDYTPASSK